MTAGGHLENLKNRDISETVWTKYCIICMIAVLQSLPADQNIKLLKIHDGGRPPF